MRHRSYTEKLFARRRARRLAGMLLVAVLAAGLAHGCLLQSVAIGSQAMLPTLEPGDFVLISPAPFGISTPFGSLPALRAPRRGELVLVDVADHAGTGLPERALDAVLRFLTLQRVSTMEAGDGGTRGTRSVRRVIGLPGDTVRMESWVLFVRPRDSSGFGSEHELSPARYATTHAPVPEGWRADLPGSGFMAETTVPDGQYFLAGDHRGSSADSTMRGTYRAAEIRGDLLFRFWPPTRIGIP